MVDPSSANADSPKDTHLYTNGLWLCLVAAVCVIAIALRVVTHDVSWRTPDEKTYISYATQVGQSGAGAFRALVSYYNRDSTQWLYPPPLRVGYVLAVAELANLFGTSAEKAGTWLAFASSLVGFFVAALLGWRFFDRWTTLFTLAFLSVSPLDLAIARRTWADSLVGAAGILLVYLCLEASVSIRPNKWRIAFWIVGIYFLLTKEFAIFIYGLCVLWLLTEVWLQRRSWKAAATVAAPSALTVLVSYAFLIWIAGGLNPMLQLYHHLGQAHISNQYVNLYQRGPWYSFPLGFWVLSPFTTLFAGVGIAQIILRRNSLTAIFADAWQRRGTVAIALFVPAVLAVATFLPGFKSLRFVSVVAVPICIVGGFLISHLLAEARTRFAPAVSHCVLCVVTIVVALVCISDYIRFQRIFVHYELDDVTVPRVVNFAFAADSGWDKARAETFDSSSFPEYQLLRSLVLYDQGRYAEAIKACQAALNLKPDCAEAWNNICAAENKLGRYQEAAAACEQALRYKPDFELARNNLQYAREKLKASAK